MMKNIKNIPGRLTPPQSIVLSFMMIIMIGSGLLMMPAASRAGVVTPFLDALFTATSAACVTGLTVVNTAGYWSGFGHVIILILIQLGGLGVMTLLTLGMVSLRRRVSLKDRLIIQASFNQDSAAGMVRLVRLAALSTFIIEGIGALALAAAFWISDQISVAEALWRGVFHSVSAFCNGGFDILGTDSLSSYSGNLAINVIIMILIIAGGLGFLVLAELSSLNGLIRRHRKRFYQKKSLRRKLYQLSLHSKIALSVTIILIFSGAILFMLLEWQNPGTMGSMPLYEKVLTAFFQSVTLRTAGFNTLNQANLSEASIFLSCLFMLVGGSPAGTAGGIKTVTLGVMAAAVISVLKGRRRIESFGRTLPLQLLLKALTVVFTLLVVIISSTLLLWITQQDIGFNYSFLDLLFESSSAAATVGITTGITPFLNPVGKLIITICMFIGRLSPVTVVVALNMKMHATGDSIRYPEEKVIIG